MAPGPTPCSQQCPRVLMPQRRPLTAAECFLLACGSVLLVWARPSPQVLGSVGELGAMSPGTRRESSVPPGPGPRCRPRCPCARAGLCCRWAHQPAPTCSAPGACGQVGIPGRRPWREGHRPRQHWAQEREVCLVGLHSGRGLGGQAVLGEWRQDWQQPLGRAESLSRPVEAAC